ncbi:hypothetical protein B0T25DRAFT_450779 [Lasiosphaeria hispida]|uniref:Rhodopsin domain-containing protein n=1 Tax=Lasiosphaeria hispida TaxID=260671 RepID=A0AAJ0HKJ4_9PEZI|nr:hypothetical protein B0T25DRAFT_450779 [Lasiosphaeria hispida]
MATLPSPANGTAVLPSSSASPDPPGNPHPANYAWFLNVSIWILATSSTTFLLLRIWGKRWRDRKLWWDDHFLISSWVCLIISCILQSFATTLGFGMDNRDIKDLVTTRLVSLIAGFFLIIAAAWSKTSFAITLLRISDGWIRKFVWFVLLSTNVAMALSGVIQWAPCWPIQKQWHMELPGVCLQLRFINGYNIFVAAYSGLMDVALALLPWKIVWPMVIWSRREKLGITFSMSLGVL